MTSRHMQTALSIIFIGLGAWCLLMPGMVESLVFRPQFQHLSATSMILMGCFGAQAVLAGLVILTSDFRPSTFLVFGLFGSLPFFAFNYYFYFSAKIFSEWMLLDFAGNIGILTLGLLGYHTRKKEISDASVVS